MTRLNELLGMVHIACKDTRVIQGISDDSRQLAKDWLFVARKGISQDGWQYGLQALEKGAVVLCNAQDMAKIKKQAYAVGKKSKLMENIYVCPDVEALVQVLIELYYGDLCADLCVIGVTGTSGKTSVASTIAYLLRSDGKHVLRIGTHEVSDGKQVKHIPNTTPGSFQLALLLSQAVQSDITHVVMEVSSHAIDQNRISFMHYDALLYTNITQDHLDYHYTKVHYRYTKFKLRRYCKKNACLIVNADDPGLLELAQLSKAKLLTFGFQPSHFTIEQMELSAHGASFLLNGYLFHSPLLGKMNVYNVVEALILCHQLGMRYETLQQSVSKLPAIPGRMEVYKQHPFAVWIDYAHTPDAVEKLLQFAQTICQGNVYIIIGCGGERDSSKRKLMADAACKYSKLAVFTSDNPRREPITQILLAMCKTNYQNYEVFENRYFAIKFTIKIAKDSDIIIIAGKGNEKTQEVEGIQYPFDDHACVDEQFAKEESFWK